MRASPLPAAPGRPAAPRPARRPRCSPGTRAFGNLLGLLSPGPKADITDCEPALTRWLAERGLPPQKVAVQQIAGQGRGLVARQRLAKGELLLKVGMDLVLSEERVLAGWAVLRAVSGDLQLPSWSVLALWLAEQRYYHTQRASGSSSSGSSSGSSGGGGSEWGPYLDVLPDKAGTVLDWLPGEADRWLSPGLRAKARIIEEANAATWHQIAPLVARAEASGAAPPGMFTRGSVAWGVGLLLSRSVRLDAAGGDTVLVPYADFANHDVGADCFLDYDAGSDCVGVRLDRGYAPGEQVLISYCPKSSGELLLSYGFSPPPGSNPYDAAFLELGLPHDSASVTPAGQGSGGRPSPSKSGGKKGGRQPAASSSSNSGGGGGGGGSAVVAAKRAAMAARGVPDTEVFGVRLEGLPEGLLDYIAYIDAPLESADEAEPLAEALLTRGELSPAYEALALEGLARRCKEALRACPQDAAADRKLAESVAGGGGYEQREALCAAIRTRERAILAKVEFAAAQGAKAIRRGGGGGGR